MTSFRAPCALTLLWRGRCHSFVSSHRSKICPQHAQWKWWFGRTGWDIGLCLIPLWELAGFDGPSEIHCQDHSKSDILTSSGSLRHDVLSRFLWVVTLVLTEEEPYLMNTGRFRKTNRFVEGEYIKYAPIDRLLLFIKKKKKERKTGCENKRLLLLLTKRTQVLKDPGWKQFYLVVIRWGYPWVV